KEEEVEEEIRKFGFNDVHEAVRELLEIEHFERTSGLEIAVSAPFYARQTFRKGVFQNFRISLIQLSL
ncbi:MAG TPA: hypothetical protein VMW40_06000, partial [Candidatus Bathyarchaeia archaeon]|nr:hypothetical protein [Candidatus Bathyarchaeia archaeon]